MFRFRRHPLDQLGWQSTEPWYACLRCAPNIHVARLLWDYGTDPVGVQPLFRFEATVGQQCDMCERRIGC